MKKEFVLIIGMLLMSNIFLVGAVEFQTNDKATFFSDLKYQLNKLGLFTAEGQSRQCSVTPDFIWNPIINNSISKSEFLSKVGKPSALINRFNRNYQFIEEHRVENIGSGIYFGGVQIVEVYGCSYSPCQTNSDCKAPYGDTCNPTYGACYYSQTTPSHQTKVYACDSGQFVLNRNAAYGQSNFCLDPTNNNYIDAAGNEHCATNPNSVWCPTTIGGGDNEGAGTGEEGTTTQCFEIKNPTICEELGCVWDFELNLNLGDCKSIGIGTGGTQNQTTFSGAKKIALDKETISKSTSGDLLASSCLSGSECVVLPEDSEDFRSRCIPISKLRTEGVLTETDKSNFFSNAHNIARGTIIGGSAGVIACIIAGETGAGLFGLGAGAILASPAIVGGCAALGGALGGVGTDMALDIFENDELIKQLNAENELAVGICTLEPKEGTSFAFLEGLAFFDITGDGIKDGTDGLIITGGGFILLIILFRSFGGIYRYE